MQSDETIDCIGLYCPMPIIKTAEKIKQLAVGQVLEILADDTGIVDDLPNWCQLTGHEFMGIEKNEDGFQAWIKKR
ncbi:sulfurtransferase TusA family protein [candidate division KSB1 bacterium]|nr:sulfurtransferase TusA family protein [candidate division KSB1 bacterium]